MSNDREVERLMLLMCDYALTSMTGNKPRTDAAEASLRSELERLVADARRYATLIESSPRQEICFLGESYFGKPALDKAIDAIAAEKPDAR